jgi:NADPH:quinone reductase-like Zn-dependent oxidoreductase
MNQAAWIKKPKAKPLEVDSAQDYEVGPDEILIQNYVVAINPVDWKVQVG